MFGANGAGKTTTINLFLNFIPPTSGKALVEGVDVAMDPLSAKKHVSFVSENVMLYGNFTAIQNLDYFSKLAGKRHLAKKDYAEVLERVGLQKEAFDRRVKNFSKGMRQKLGIAIALVKDAANVLLDEPTSGLDPSRAGNSSRSWSRCGTRASPCSCRPMTSSGQAHRRPDRLHAQGPVGHDEDGRGAGARGPDRPLHPVHGGAAGRADSASGRAGDLNGGSPTSGQRRKPLTAKPVGRTTSTRTCPAPRSLGLNRVSTVSPGARSGRGDSPRSSGIAPFPKAVQRSL